MKIYYTKVVNLTGNVFIAVKQFLCIVTRKKNLNKNAVAVLKLGAMIALTRGD